MSLERFAADLPKLQERPPDARDRRHPRRRAVTPCPPALSADSLRSP
ncbi:hypothetical protein [Lysobacter gummosus]